MSKAQLLKVEDLRVTFPSNAPLKATGVVRAVDGVNFTLERGRTLGLVGESGCGKSTLGYSLIRLVQGSGNVELGGVDLLSLSQKQMRAARRRLQIVFQDAAASLDPKQTIGNSIREALDIHGLYPGRQRAGRVADLLRLVGMPERFAERYPFELSGGQAQRIAICRALAVEPDIIICDEAVSALDVSIQAQILNLLQKLQKELGVSYIFISHDLSVVRHVSHDIAVMYLGRIVEYGGSSELFDNPTHPYTRALLSAAPLPDPDFEAQRQAIILKGDLPDPANPPSGCRFRTRCPVAGDECATTDPQPAYVSETHFAACIKVVGNRPI